MRPGARRGATLVELVLATGLASLALVAVVSVLGILTRSQALGQKDLRAQLDAIAAIRQIERELRQSSYLVSPAAGVGGASVLSGCANASVKPGEGAPTPDDPARPMRGYALCSTGGALYHHEGSGCPLSYTCGSGGTLVAGAAGGATASASFTRASARSAFVEAAVTVTAGGASLRLEGGAAVAASPGALP